MPRVSKRVSSFLYAVAIVAGVLGCLQLYSSYSSRQDYRRKSLAKMVCLQKCSKIGMAMRDFYDIHGSFPSPYSVDEEGRPLLSWRVHILPFLGCEDLYNQFKLNEPWNSKHNSELARCMPDVYRCVASAEALPNVSCYLMLVSGRSFGGEGATRTEGDITDGLDTTLMVVESPMAAVEWTKPEDISLSLLIEEMGETTKRGTSPHFGGRHAITANGQPCEISEDIPPSVLRAMATIDGGEGVICRDTVGLRKRWELSREATERALKYDSGHRAD